MRCCFTHLSIAAVVPLLLSGLSCARAQAAAPASVNTLESEVKLLQTLNGLHLNQGQLREIVQRLSNYFHAADTLEEHRTAAGLPVAATLKRLKAALETGKGTAAADQQQVREALAGLKPEEARVERLRGETISAIGGILTPTQRAAIRRAAGLPSAADGMVNGQDPQLFFGVEDQPLPWGAINGTTPFGTNPPGAPPRGANAPGPVDNLPPGIRDLLKRRTGALTVTPEGRIVSLTLAPPGADAPQPVLAPPPVALPQLAPRAPTPIILPIQPDRAAGDNPIDLEARMQQLEQRLADLEMKLKQFPAPPTQLDTRAAPDGFTTIVPRAPVQVAAPQIIQWQVAAGAGGNIDDRAVEAIFMQREALTFCQRRAAQ